jgi:hypothetical protein
MSLPLSLVRQSDREIVFSYRRILAVGALALAVLAAIVSRYAANGILESAGFGIVAIGSAALAVTRLAWQERLTLDLSTRTWTERRGYWPMTQTATGGFSSLDGLFLTEETRVRKYSTYPLWIIHLAFKGDRAPVTLGEFLDERTANDRLRELEATLRIDDRPSMPASTPGQTTPTRAGAQRLHLTLVGFVTVASVAFVGLLLNGTAPVFPDEMGSIRYVFPAAAISLIIAAGLWALPHVPTRSTSLSTDEYWTQHEVGGRALMLWILLEGAVLVSSVGTFLTGSRLAAFATLIAWLLLVASGPQFLERRSGLM